MLESTADADGGRGGRSSGHSGAAPGVANWTGSWKTSDVSIGRIARTQNGNTLSGRYHNGNRRITGTVNGNVFSGQWSEGRSRRGGSMTLALQADGRTLKGSWSLSTSPGTQASFTATRE